MIGDSLCGDILQVNNDILREMESKPTTLENGYVLADIDVSLFDNSKTSKRIDGYVPILAKIRTKCYFVNTQLRIKKQY